MYYCESEVQHEKFKNVGQAMWWALATLTTVGCGDVHLVTNASKFLSAKIVKISIGVAVLSTSIISYGFIEKIRKSEAKDKKICVCSKCENMDEV